MAKNTVIQGGDLMLFVGEAGSEKSIALATNHTLSINADTKETSTKDSGGKWQTSEVGILSWSGSSENLITIDPQGNGYTTLVDYMINRTKIHAIFTIEGNSTDLETNKLDTVPDGGWDPADSSKYTGGYEGDVIITSVELNAPNGENATFTVQFTGTGALTKVA